MSDEQQPTAEQLLQAVEKATGVQKGAAMHAARNVPRRPRSEGLAAGAARYEEHQQRKRGGLRR